MVVGHYDPFIIILGLVAFSSAMIGLALYMSVPEGFHLERRHFVYVCIAAVASSLYVASLTAIYHLQTREDFWKYLGLYLGPALVAVGWVVTNEVNVLNSRKQHTINLILQYFTNAKRIEDKDSINSKLPWPNRVDEALHDFDNTADDLLRTIARELNYFDFLASAIIRREIEERLLRRVFQNVVRHYFIQFAPYIRHWQKDNMETWADFVALYDMWRLPADPISRTPA